MKKKMMMALALAGSLWLGGTAMAMDVNVDSATKGMPGKVESTFFPCLSRHRSLTRFPMWSMNRFLCGAIPMWP